MAVVNSGRQENMTRKDCIDRMAILVCEQGFTESEAREILGAEIGTPSAECNRHNFEIRDSGSVRQ